MKRKWKTKDGRKLWIKDMDNNHLLNTLRFLERGAKHEQGKVQTFYTLTSGPK